MQEFNKYRLIWITRNHIPTNKWVHQIEHPILKVDFSRVSVQMKFEGDPEIIDFRKSLGNAIRAASGDIALDEFARKVYFSEGEVEVPHEYIKFILHVIEEKYNIPSQEALKSLLTI